MRNALVPLADGVEEMEAVIVVDVLRRARWNVTVAAVGPLTVTASRGVRLVGDTEWAAVDPAAFDVLVLPGGMGGTQVLCRDERVLETVRCFVESERLVGAICAGPLVLQAAGVLDGRRATCHPGVRGQLRCTAALPDRVVRDGVIVTSQGPGTTFEFALALIAATDGAALARSVADGLLLPPGCSWPA